MPEHEVAWELPSRGRVGMFCLIVAEAAIFTIFVVAYLFYLGKSLTGPTPKDVLHVPIFYTICLLVQQPDDSLRGRGARARRRPNASALCGSLTIALGATFLYGTAPEWRRLIYEEGLTIRTNLFGTTYYSLVGLHGLHVTVGLARCSSMVCVLARCGQVDAGAHRSHGRALYLLALRGCGVGGRVLVVYYRSGEDGDEARLTEDDRIGQRCPPRRAWPIVPAFGVPWCSPGWSRTRRQRARGDAWPSRDVGWFREVLPSEKHESVPVVARNR